MEKLEGIYRLWPLVIAVITFIAWLIRLENNHMHLKKDFEEYKKEKEIEKQRNEKEVKENQKEINEKFDSLMKQNLEIFKAVSRMEGILEHRKGV